MIEVARMSLGKTASPDRSAVTGLISSIAASTMLMAALASAYIVRRGLGSDWEPLHLPFVLPGGALLLLLSSLAIETGRRAYKSGSQPRFVRSWFSGVALGMTFILAQVYGWTQISRTGVSMATSPAAAFLFVITGLFVALTIGGVLALVWSGFRISRGNRDKTYTRVAIAAYYWHYLDCLWIYLVFLFYLRS